jgi:hypothetical protein
MHVEAKIIVFFGCYFFVSMSNPTKNMEKGANSFFKSVASISFRVSGIFPETLVDDGNDKAIY